MTQTGNDSLLYMYDVNMSNLFVKLIENHLHVLLMNQFHLRYVLVEAPQKGGKGPKVKEIVKEVLNNSESNVWQKEVSSIKER